MARGRDAADVGAHDNVWRKHAALVSRLDL